MRSLEFGSPSAALRLRQASGRARQQLGRRRPALHATQQYGLHGDLAPAQPDKISEDTGLERLLFRRLRLSLPVGPYADARQIAWRDDSGRSGGVGPIRA